MSTTLVKIIEQSGLEKSKADYLLEKFADYTAIAEQWSAKAKEIVVTDESQTDLMKQASEGRKLLKNKRVDIEKTRKELKAASLAEGRAIDSIAGALTALIEPTEKYLDEQEKFAERKEAERIKSLQAERWSLIKPYVDESLWLAYSNLGTLQQGIFDNMLLGAKTTYENKIAAEKKAEEDRIAKEEQDKKDRESQRIENERLKKEADEREAKFHAEMEEFSKKVKADEEKARKEREAIQKKLDEERKENEQKQIASEREFQRLKDEQQKVIREAEEKEKREREEQEKLESAPDKEKIKDLIKRLQEFELPEVKTKLSKALIQGVKGDLTRIVTGLSISLKSMK